MSEYAIPKGVNLDTLRDLIEGWAAVGAGVTPRLTVDVEEETGVTDAAGRQNAFLEELGILESADQQRHELTDTGHELARALAKEDEDAAREIVYDRLDEWPPMEQVKGMLRDNPMSPTQLRPVVAAITGHDVEHSRVDTGVRTLLDLMEWSGHLTRDAEDRYTLPEEAGAGERPEIPLDLEPAVHRIEAEPEAAVERVEPKAAMERVRPEAAEAESGTGEEAAEVEAGAGEEASEPGEAESPPTSEVRTEAELPGTRAVAETEADLPLPTSAHAIETASHIPGGLAPWVPQIPAGVTGAPVVGGAELEVPRTDSETESSTAEAEETVEGAAEGTVEGAGEGIEGAAEESEEAVEAAAEEADEEAVDVVEDAEESVETVTDQAQAADVGALPPGVSPVETEGKTEDATGGTAAEPGDSGVEESEGTARERIEDGGLTLELAAEPEVDIEPGDDGGIQVELTVHPEDVTLAGEEGLPVSALTAAAEGETSAEEVGQAVEEAAGEVAPAGDEATEAPADEGTGMETEGEEAAGGPEVSEGEAEPAGAAEPEGAEAAGGPEVSEGEAEPEGAAEPEVSEGEAEPEGAGKSAEAEEPATAEDSTETEATESADTGEEPETAAEGAEEPAAGTAEGAGDETTQPALQTARPGEDALGVALDLNLDADPEQIEALVRGLKHGLTEGD